MNITSNNIKVRNLNEKGNVHSGEVTSLVNKTVNASGYSLLELTVVVNSANSGTFVSVIKGGNNYDAASNPTLFDSSFREIPNRRMYLSTTGRHKIYVQLNGHSDLRVHINPLSGTTPRADVTVEYELSNEKFDAFSFAIKNFDDRVLKQYRNITWRNGQATSLPTVSFTKISTLNQRYALIEYNSYGTSTGSYFGVIVYDSADTPIYPEVLLASGQNVANNLGQVYFTESGLKRVYIDLQRYKAETISITRHAADNIEATFSLIGFSNELPEYITGGSFEEENKSLDEVLFETDKFRFKKIGNFKDAFQGQLLDFDANYVYWTDDPKKPRKKIYDLSAITTAQGTSISQAYIVPYDPLEQLTTRNSRIVVEVLNRKVYHNYYNGGGENSWGESKFWEQRGTRRKIPVKSLGEVDAYHRYDVTQPEERYGKDTYVSLDGITFIECLDRPRLRFLGALCRTKKQVSFGTYLTDGSRICQWTTTDGGANWVMVYDFMNSYVQHSQNINTSTLSDYTGGLTLSKVVLTPPSEADKEPASPFSYDDISFQGITKGEQTVVNATAHGLVNGDIVIFRGTPQDTGWSSLVCENATPTFFSPIAYSVEVINADSFRIKEYLGSYDNPLYARHIHSTNEWQRGVVFSTGETYPNGWTMVLAEYSSKDSNDQFTMWRVQKHAHVTRLNSTAKSIHRPCGVLFYNDGTMIFNSDDGYQFLPEGRFKFQIEGRTESTLPTRSSYGVWKGNLTDIDDWSKWECKLSLAEPGIWLYQVGSIIVGYGMLGANYISFDNGETWDLFNKGTSIVNGVFDNRIVIGDGYIFEWK